MHHQSFMPHGFCFLWNSDLIRLTVITDSLIAVAYYSIPVALFLLAIKKKETIPVRPLFMLFGLFIFFCGGGHALDILSIWKPVYWLKGWWNAGTAATSIWTAIVLIPRVVEFVKLPATAERLQQETAALQEQKGRLQDDLRARSALLDLAHDSIMVITLNGEIEFWNGGAEELYGYTRQEALGSISHDLLRTRFPEPLSVIKKRLMTQTVWQGELAQAHRDGHEILVSSRWALRRDGDGRPTGFLEINRDITEAKRAERALRELSGRLLRAQDDERRRLAQELHDSTAQTIAALGWNLEVVSGFVDRLDESGRHALTESQAMADDCVCQLRTFSYLLCPPMLQERGLVSALSSYVDGFSRRSKIAVDLHVPAKFERLPKDVDTALFRVVQESLVNIHRHSGSCSASIRIVRHTSSVVLTVRDRGHGILKPSSARPGATSCAGVGIESMRERVRYLGGRVDLLSNAHGTLVKVQVPLDPSSTRLNLI
jgi:PAS domain S-box-containing protein